MYTPGLERSHWTNEQHFARQMSFVLCRPSWEPTAFHLTFRSLRYFWSLSVTGTWASTNTFPKNPQVFMRVSVEGDWALRQPQEHPGARGPCAPWPGSRLSAGSGVGAGAASHGQSPQHALSGLARGMGLQPHPRDSRTPPWPRWTPRRAWSQSRPTAPCSTVADPHLGSPGRQQRWRSPSKSLLPSQHGKHPLDMLAMLMRLWWPAETDASASSTHMPHQHGQYSRTVSPASASTRTLWIHHAGKMGTFEKSSSKVKWNCRFFQQKRSSRTACWLTPKALELLSARQEGDATLLVQDTFGF